MDTPGQQHCVRSITESVCALAFVSRSTSLQIRNEKNSPKRKFSGRISCGRPGVIRLDAPDQKLQAGPRNLGKIGIWVRMSMTRTRGRPRLQGGARKLRQKHLFSGISKPVVWGTRGLHPGFPWFSSFSWFP